MATRKTSEAVLQALGPVIPELMGGSADLNPSTFTWLKGQGDFEKPGAPPACLEGAVGGEWGYGGRNIHFGVREHAMAALAGGMALHGGIIPFTGTFFTFADYMRPSIRLAALMGLRVIYVFTHDSIGVGEDGPTHQPIEHLMSLRAIPNLTVIRAADANETAEAWRMAVLNDRVPRHSSSRARTCPFWTGPPAARPPVSGEGDTSCGSRRTEPEAILIGTGSEVEIALAAGKTLAAEGVRIRVVSLPSWELFDGEPQEWRDRVLPPELRARVAIEAGLRLGWEHYVGLEGEIVGIDHFGASAPSTELYRQFGITAEAAATAVRRLLGR